MSTACAILLDLDWGSLCMCVSVCLCVTLFPFCRSLLAGGVARNTLTLDIGKQLTAIVTDVESQCREKVYSAEEEYEGVCVCVCVCDTVVCALRASAGRRCTVPRRSTKVCVSVCLCVCDTVCVCVCLSVTLCVCVCGVDKNGVFVVWV